MLKQKLLDDLKEVVKDLEYKQVSPVIKTSDVVISISKNPNFGDYTSNIALQLANLKIKKSNQNPAEIAKQIIKQLAKKDYLEKAEVAGPGFINFYIKTEALIENLPLVCNYTAMVDSQIKVEGKKRRIFMEYAQPNTHKTFHMGHTRNIILGESISRLFESAGSKVFRSTYGSDIGLPVAKALWGVRKLSDELNRVKKTSLKEKAQFLGEAYAKGATAYDEDEVVRREISQLNKAIYEKDPEITPLWEETRQWSLDYFNDIYALLDTKFDKIFHESEVQSGGKKLVEDNLGKVFVEDQGAVIFPGDKYGLHNRVFITSAGLPTYEAKDLRLAKLKEEIWPFDLAIIFSGSEQTEYFKVMFKALERIDSNFKGKMVNFPYGTANFASGKKMSSRKGEVITFDYLLEEVEKGISALMKKEDLTKEEREQVIKVVSLGAIKFSMLKYAPRTNMIFDLKTSISLEGDSGPYVQYTYARAKSVLRMAQYDYQPIKDGRWTLEPEERMILRRIEQFPEIVKEAAESFSPQIVANFLLDLSKEFNLFYQEHRIIKASESDAKFRLALTCAVAVSLKQGLYLLGIESPERM